MNLFGPKTFMSFPSHLGAFRSDFELVFVSILIKNKRKLFNFSAIKMRETTKKKISRR